MVYFVFHFYFLLMIKDRKCKVNIIISIFIGIENYKNICATIDDFGNLKKHLPKW